MAGRIVTAEYTATANRTVADAYQTAPPRTCRVVCEVSTRNCAAAEKL